MTRGLAVAELLAATMIAVAAAGCGAQTGADGSAGDIAGSWQLTSGAGPDGAITADDPHRITLLLADDGQLRGTAACNGYGGRARIDGDRFALDGVSHTEMACNTDVMAAEAAYLAALQRAERIRVSGDRLLLSGPSVELAFERLLPVPAAELVGITWELETLIDDDLASSAIGGATLRLDANGGIAGGTGCRAFSGRYVLRGDEVLVTRLAADETAGTCPPAESEQEAVVVDVLGDGFRVEIEGARLTVTAGERGLVHRAR